MLSARSSSVGLCALITTLGAGVLLATATPETPADAGAGALFATHCAACHGPDGRARVPAARKLGVKDLTRGAQPADEVRRRIVDGMREKAGRLRMPGFKDKLTEEQIDALVAFVVAMRSAATETRAATGR